MKKKQIKNLKLSKSVIANIQLSKLQKIKGGTDPISPPHSAGISACASQCGNMMCF